MRRLACLVLLGACATPPQQMPNKIGRERPPAASSASTAPDRDSSTVAPGPSVPDRGSATAAPGPTAPAAATPAPALPSGFEVKGTPLVREPFLEPAATWRFVVSRLTTLRMDARAAGAPVCVTFEADAVHVTERSGRRRTWRLPRGLRLAGVPAHVVLGADLATVAYRGDGTQIPAAEEVTVVTAQIADGGENVQKKRLVIKGGRGFRSISTAEPQ